MEYQKGKTYMVRIEVNEIVHPDFIRNNLVTVGYRGQLFSTNYLLPKYGESIVESWIKNESLKIISEVVAKKN